MAKKKAILICGAVLLLLAVVIAGVAAWFFSPGVHYLWGFANYDIAERPCFIIDPESEKVIDQTVLTLDRTVNWFEEKTGSIPQSKFEIPGYTGLAKNPAAADVGACRTEDGEWELTYWEAESDDGVLLPKDGTYITAQIWIEDVSPVVEIHYDDYWERNDVYAVCADSEEEALRIYREFMK